MPAPGWCQFWCQFDHRKRSKTADSSEERASGKYLEILDKLRATRRNRTGDLLITNGRQGSTTSRHGELRARNSYASRPARLVRGGTGSYPRGDWMVSDRWARRMADLLIAHHPGKSF